MTSASPARSTAGPSQNRYCALLGNGASIAYNPDLSIPALTAGLVAKFEGLGGVDVQGALSAYAHGLSGTNPDDFERLLAPIEHAARGLPALAGLVGLAGSAQAHVGQALSTTRAFMLDVHRMGMGIALGLIADRTHGRGEVVHDTTVIAVAEALLALGPVGRVTVATLNYDGLLHSGMLNSAPSNEVCDLSDGREDDKLRVVSGQPELSCRLLRSTDDLPTPRTAIVQLHGSLGWLRDRERPDRVRKFNIEDLRAVRYWDALRDGRALMDPVVILTDQKVREAAGWPFGLAYDIFQDRLRQASRWLVAGYGFGDEPVASAMNLAYRHHHDRGALRLLVVDFEKPADEVRKLARDATGLPGSQIDVDTTGIPACLSGEPWQAWAA